MKHEEKIANRHLEARGFEDIIFEPDGNIPPDFLVNNEIAIEVRRLNKHFDSIGQFKGLENLRFSLMYKVQNMLKTIAYPVRHESYFISFHFRRPFPKPDTVVNEIKNKLTEFIKSGIGGAQVWEISDQLILKAFPASKKYEKPFLLGSYVDLDAGGFVVSDIYQNLKICIKEKEYKVLNYRHKYPVWWLLLIDYIGYGLSERDHNQVIQLDPIDHTWDKVIIVAPLKPEDSVEI